MPKPPGIRHKDAIRVLEKAGWRVIREGKHTIMGKGSVAIPIPWHNPIDPFTMGGIAKSAGLTPEQFRDLPAKLRVAKGQRIEAAHHNRLVALAESVTVSRGRLKGRGCPDGFIPKLDVESSYPS